MLFNQFILFLAFNFYLETYILIHNQLHSSDHLRVIGGSSKKMFYTKLHGQIGWIIFDMLIGKLINHPRHYSYSFGLD